jgi:hypothetical protein
MQRRRVPHGSPRIAAPDVVTPVRGDDVQPRADVRLTAEFRAAPHHDHEHVLDDLVGETRIVEDAQRAGAQGRRVTTHELA